MKCLESSGWTVHTRLEDPCELVDQPIESLDPDKRDPLILERLKTLHALKKVLIVTTSHVGGHKFAGNCIVSFPPPPLCSSMGVGSKNLGAFHPPQIHIPQGSAVWYGRVTPHEVPAIVQHTIIEGEILFPLLRGYGDISRPSRQSLYDW